MNQKIHIFSGHSVVAHMMAILRNIKTSAREFRSAIDVITFVMGSEVLKNIPTKKVLVQTPMATTRGEIISDMPCIVPILRAGLSMQNAMWQLIPDMPSYDIGLKRVEDGSPKVKIEEYLNKLPKELPAGKLVIILDPMIASGTSACHAIDLVKKTGAKNIVFMGLVSCDKGLKSIMRSHPDVTVFCAVKDPKLGKNNYIYPGLGDAGDRYKNT